MKKKERGKTKNILCYRTRKRIPQDQIFFKKERNLRYKEESDSKILEASTLVMKIRRKREREKKKKQRKDTANARSCEGERGRKGGRIGGGIGDG